MQQKFYETMENELESILYVAFAVTDLPQALGSPVGEGA